MSNIVLSNTEEFPRCPINIHSHYYTWSTIFLSFVPSFTNLSWEKRKRIKPVPWRKQVHTHPYRPGLWLPLCKQKFNFLPQVRADFLLQKGCSCHRKAKIAYLGPQTEKGSPIHINNEAILPKVSLTQPLQAPGAHCHFQLPSTPSLRAVLDVSEQLIAAHLWHDRSSFNSIIIFKKLKKTRTKNQNLLSLSHACNKIYFED